MSAGWPWLVLVGLGAYHGLNPAMGWLFAVALGLHRGSRWVVLQSLIPIAIGHAAAIAVVAGAVVALGVVVNQSLLRAIGGSILLLWALYRALYGTRHRVRVGMQVGFAGLIMWSFLMAGAHGAGLMAVPALVPLCLGETMPIELGLGSPGVALFAVVVHTVAMLIVTAAIAILVYEWLGLAFLRRGWFNLDRVWTGALVVAGCALLVPTVAVSYGAGLWPKMTITTGNLVSISAT
jgi:hypothetical protein